MRVRGFGPGFSGPLQLVAPVHSQADRAAFGTVVSAASHARGVVTTIGPAYFPAGPGHPAVALAEVYPTGSPQAVSTAKLITSLRNEVIPGALHGQHLQVLVGGQTATGIDVASQLSSKLPLLPRPRRCAIRVRRWRSVALGPNPRNLSVDANVRIR